RPDDSRFNNGVDRLTNIERLQFSDQSLVLTPGLHAEPLGLRQVLDHGTGQVDTTPQIGQVLRASATNITDADGITGPISFVWQFEEIAGSNIFPNIVAEGGDKPSTASGNTFTVTPDLAGLRIRATAIYQDGHQVLEFVRSDATSAVTGTATPTPLPSTLPDGSDVPSAGIHLLRGDLEFILQQIVISERHAAGENLLDILPNSRLALGLRSGRRWVHR